jgi:hypothetical protein
MFVGNPKGARLDSFSPTMAGVNASPEAAKAASSGQKQAYVSIGAAMSTQQAHDAIAPSDSFPFRCGHVVLADLVLRPLQRRGRI